VDLIYIFIKVCGVILGIVVLYCLIQSAVKSGILAAHKEIEKNKLKDQLNELKAKQDTQEKP